MEALAIIGLIGIGLISSNDDEDNTDTSVRKTVSLPTSDNLYNSEFYEKSNEIIRNKAGQNFESTMEDGNQVISNIKENRDGSGYLEEIVMNYTKILMTPRKTFQIIYTVTLLTNILVKIILCLMTKEYLHNLFSNILRLRWT